MTAPICPHRRWTREATQYRCVYCGETMALGEAETEPVVDMTGQQGVGRMPEVKLPTTEELDRIAWHVADWAADSMPREFVERLLPAAREAIRLKEEHALLGRLWTRIGGVNGDPRSSENLALIALLDAIAEEAGKGAR